MANLIGMPSDPGPVQGRGSAHPCETPPRRILASECLPCYVTLESHGNNCADDPSCIECNFDGGLTKRTAACYVERSAIHVPLPRTRPGIIEGQARAFRNLFADQTTWPRQINSSIPRSAVVRLGPLDEPISGWPRNLNRSTNRRSEK